MTIEKKPTTIKKYANRRLYDTGTSTYVTLEDLAAMVKRGEDFVVTDAKSGDDITRPVLAQIIFEQEGKDGQAHSRSFCLHGGINNEGGEFNEERLARATVWPKPVPPKHAPKSGVMAAGKG